MEPKVQKSSQRKPKEVSDLERERIINEYLNTSVRQKYCLCPYWWRGLCLFKKEVCRYAHGIEDIEFTTETLHKNMNLGRCPVRLTCLKLERKHYVLYDYQDELIQRGEIDHKVTLEVIDSNKDIRRNIRRLFHKHEAAKVIPFIFERFKDIFITKEFFTGILKGLAIPISIMNLNNHQYYYEIKEALPPSLTLKKEYLIKMPPIEEFKENVDKKLADIIFDLLNIEIPIKTELITKEYYKRKEFFDPPLHIFIQRLDITLDEYFTELEETGIFQKKLGISEETKIFCTNYLFSHKELDLFFEFLEKESKPIMTFAQLHKTLPKFKLIKGVSLLKEPIKLIAKELYKRKKANISIFSNLIDWYIVNNTLKATTETFESIKMNKKCKCYKEIEAFSNLSCDEKLIAKFENERVILVDNKETLAFAKFAIPKFKIISVDLEGRLRFFNCHIYLIQIGTIKENGQRQIFVFDTFSISSGQDLELNQECNDLISFLMNNKEIIKVFHDCKRDSSAIHSHFKCCVSNARDTSAVHIILRQLEMYEKNLLENPNKLYSCISTLTSPGLNEILSLYQASNGINSFKEEMKEKFHNSSNLFTTRPINPDFLEYSVKDVEDLSECYLNMEKKAIQLGKNLQTKIEEDQILELIIKSSRSYSKYGCKEYLENTKDLEEYENYD